MEIVWVATQRYDKNIDKSDTDRSVFRVNVISFSGGPIEIPTFIEINIFVRTIL